MVSVPMAAVGGFAGLRLLNLFTVQQLDTLTMLGFVILVGTVAAQDGASHCSHRQRMRPNPSDFHEHMDNRARNAADGALSR